MKEYYEYSNTNYVEQDYTCDLEELCITQFEYPGIPRKYNQDNHAFDEWYG